MAVKGVFVSDAHIQGNREGDFASALLEIQPQGTAPLFALTSGMESVDAGDTVVTWFEENAITGRVGITNNAGTGTSIVADDASTFTAGTVFIVEASGEHIYVDAISGNTLTVVRGFADTTITAIDGSSVVKYMQRWGTAFEEASARPPGVANLGVPRFNYMQIFRNAWDVSGTALAVDYRTGDLPAKNRADCAFLHAQDIELALHFGRKTIGTRNNQPFRTMDGVVTQIQTNVVVESGNTTWADIDSFLMSVFERNIRGKSNERIAFAGNRVIAVLNQIAVNEGVIQLQSGATEFGMKITKWMTPFGDISLMSHPLMNQSPMWQKDLTILHPGAMRVRYLRRTIPKDYNMDAGDDTMYGVLTTELTCEYRAERTGGRFTNITAAG